MTDDEPILTFATREAWEAWLAAEHERATGVWLRLARKGSPGRPSATPGQAGEVTVTRAEALEVALCHGWIDARSGRGDAATATPCSTASRPPCARRRAPGASPTFTGMLRDGGRLHP